MEKAARAAKKLGNSDIAELVRYGIIGDAGDVLQYPYTLMGIIDCAEQLPCGASHKETVDHVAKCVGYSRSKVRRDFRGVIQDVVDGTA